MPGLVMRRLDARLTLRGIRRSLLMSRVVQRPRRGKRRYRRGLSRMVNREHLLVSLVRDGLEAALTWSGQVEEIVGLV